MFNFQLYAVVGGALLLAAGSAFAYHKVVVVEQQATISKLETKVVTLTANNEILQNNVDVAIQANNTLVERLNKFEEQSSQMVHLIMEMNQKDEELTAWFEQARSTLSSVEARQLTLEQFRADPSGSIKRVNEDLACTFMHFGEQGTCYEGKFVPFGGR